MSARVYPAPGKGVNEMRAAAALLNLVVLIGCHGPAEEYFLAERQLRIPVRFQAQASEAETPFQLSDTGKAQKVARVMVEFRVQVDLDQLAVRLRERRFNRLERRRTTSEALRMVAQRSQSGFQPFLDELHGQGLVKSHRGFSVVNSLLIEIAPEGLLRLAAHPDVASIVEETESPRPVWAGASQAVDVARESWAVSNLSAELAWAEGLNGAGVLVASLDSGASASHEQLRGNYLGGERGWFDPGEGSVQPLDGAFGHGTGVLSCAVGGNVGGITLGVAPSAKWAACRALPEGRYNNILLVECADWLLNVAQPDIVINTWLLPNGGCDDSTRSVIEAWRTAEILPVFAAGNSGPEPGENASPANYAELSPFDGRALSVGGLTVEGALYPRSSRGPGACDGSIFPSLVAPAERILAALPLTASSYIEAEGTSFAAGFVAGAAALLLQRHPEASVAQVEEALRAGTVDLGRPGPDDDFGHGRLSVPRALEELEKLMRAPR